MVLKSRDFQFKQFSITQANTAMKVGTDGVLLGAWAPIGNSTTVLDVGTGTGLIALMVAQRNPTAKIIALEIEEGALADAQLNITNSPWFNRIELINMSFQEYNSNHQNLFDAIVCNPPFFESGHHAPKNARAIARHSVKLSHQELLKGAANLLKPTGTLSVIVPYLSYSTLAEIASKVGLHEKERLTVYPTPHKGAARVLSQWSKEKYDVGHTSELIIEDKGRHGYSDAYIMLTKEFYLKF